MTSATPTRIRAVMTPLRPMGPGDVIPREFAVRRRSSCGYWIHHNGEMVDPDHISRVAPSDGLTSYITFARSLWEVSVVEYVSGLTTMRLGLQVSAIEVVPNITVAKFNLDGFMTSLEAQALVTSELVTEKWREAKLAEASRLIEQASGPVAVYWSL